MQIFHLGSYTLRTDIKGRKSYLKKVTQQAVQSHNLGLSNALYNLWLLLVIYLYLCLYRWRCPHNDVRLSGVGWSKICIHGKKYACMIKFQLQCSSIFTGHRNISPESFPFLLEIFFVKECIKEITRFVAAVNNFPWEINSSNTTALHARCTLRRVRNRFSTAN